jgi:hypothetical protein
MVTLGWVAIALVIVAMVVGYFKESLGWILAAAGLGLGVFVASQLGLFVR